ncbi:DegV family protein [Iodobacter fluviatilis]|uniref:DegV family protein with EDD domain n=1 Tax=Iodobacter fluviatilis TaxID=537 RepID=A0A377Q8S7_9NEIS|nr:DegV family protein [Iodobacter fluviatilis]TCU86929.1 DegV family protein with EDD domain [Iodobacter fluviatilis]STQ90261.1 EDD domain protein, DegV family [Iodobacter fluviatilis]
MRIGLVTDSCCDLPRDFLDKHQIVILPITIHGSDGTFIDNRDPAATRDFYRRQAAAGVADFESEPFSAEQIRELFLSRLVLDFDAVFCLTVMQSRSQIFNHCSQAARAILTEYRPIREQASLNKPFTLRVFDSANIFAGQGLVVAEVARLISLQASNSEITKHIERLTQTTQGFLMPADLGQLRHQARRKGDKSVGFLSYALGSALDIKPVVRAYRGITAPVARIHGFNTGVEKLFSLARAHLERGLFAPTICVSYGGDPAVVTDMPAYQKLKQACKSHGVQLLLCEMSTTAGVNIGSGGVAIAFASEIEAELD